jgi:FtsP/CotA-like multicopper oxidase with cupredoxin domain
VYNWAEYALQPFDASIDPMPEKATRTVKIVVHQAGTLNSTGSVISKLEWEANGNIWQTERVQMPYLISVYINGEAAIPDFDAALANGGWDPKTLAFPAKIGEVLDIIWESNNLPTGGYDIHPWHAHGHHYWDLGSGNGTYDAAANEKKLEDYTPVKRDTTMLYRYGVKGALNTTAGWRAWRLRADEAGAFMVHCHIQQHSIMGESREPH